MKMKKLLRHIDKETMSILADNVRIKVSFVS